MLLDASEAKTQPWSDIVPAKPPIAAPSGLIIAVAYAYSYVGRRKIENCYYLTFAKNN